MSAKGKLSSYRPFTDVDGKDLVIDLAGGFKDIYLQVKCALGIDPQWSDRGDGAAAPRSNSVKSEIRLCLLPTRSAEDGAGSNLGRTVGHLLQARLSDLATKGN